MKFLADMGVSLKTVKWLREKAHDCVHLLDEGLERLSDAEIIVKAKLEERVVLTMDLDFSRLMAWSNDIKPSIITFRLDNERSEYVNKGLLVVLENHKFELNQGAMITVTDQNIRVHRLPL